MLTCDVCHVQFLGSPGPCGHSMCDHCIFDHTECPVCEKGALRNIQYCWCPLCGFSMPIERAQEHVSLCAMKVCVFCVYAFTLLHEGLCFLRLRVHFAT